jgi:hypothetical protein
VNCVLCSAFLSGVHDVLSVAFYALAFVCCVVCELVGV